ncbi:MAG TPA: methionyl-tRNA formyltransferase [Candidatus Saccharimonadales bacterium]|nr:methionyl-tRNA formyltransferase [Candidatus Saccharimonadales bacterium]
MTKVIFFGTADYVIPVMESLYKNYKLVGVVTQPPKLVGRKQIRTFSPVDNWAHKRKVPTFTSLDVKLPEANFGVVASYGRIIPERIIKHFPNGILNIHPSILPKYRGASPIQSQIIDGVTETGVSVIRMDDKMDHGPIVSLLRDEITPEDTNESLRRRLFEKSAKFLIELIPNYLSGKIKLKEQNEDEATFTKIMKREDGYIDMKSDPIVIERKFRALKPWPEIYTMANGKRLKILGLHLDGGKLVLDKVQLEGKKAVDFEEFKRGYPQTNF